MPTRTKNERPSLSSYFDAYTRYTALGPAHAPVPVSASDLWATIRKNNSNFCPLSSSTSPCFISFRTPHLGANEHGHEIHRLCRTAGSRHPRQQDHNLAEGTREPFSEAHALQREILRLARRRHRRVLDGTRRWPRRNNGNRHCRARPPNADGGRVTYGAIEKPRR